VTIRKIPQKDRHLAIASGDIQCAATTVETWIVWNANGIATTQIFQLDKSYGADGMVVRKPGHRDSIADLKGKTVARVGAGHLARYFALAWILKKNGMSREGRDRRQHGAGSRRPTPSSPAPRRHRRRHDLRAVPEPGARQAGGGQASSPPRCDYPMVMDTFGCTPKFLQDNPKAAAQALAKSYFEALDMIKRRTGRRPSRIMGADVKQTAEQFEQLAVEVSALAGPRREPGSSSPASMAQAFTKEAATCCWRSASSSRSPRPLDSLVDTRFIQVERPAQWPWPGSRPHEAACRYRMTPCPSAYRAASSLGVAFFVLFFAVLGGRHLRRLSCRRPSWPTR
jgi:NitT/TauT family transport system substrate-binding protein